MKSVAKSSHRGRIVCVTVVNGHTIHNCILGNGSHSRDYGFRVVPQGSPCLHGSAVSLRVDDGSDDDNAHCIPASERVLALLPVSPVYSLVEYW
jgi:hypothetical protein